MAVFDNSVAGLDGCPYGAGASGNVAMDDLAYLLQVLAIETGVEIVKPLSDGQFI
jgi:hydroxymethylglutaryl-CoA lyase